MVTTLTEITKLWENTLDRIKKKLGGDPSFDNFFANSYIYEKRGSTLIISTPHELGKVLLDGQYRKLILDTLNEIEDEDFDIVVVTEDEVREKRKQASKEEKVEKVSTPYFNNAQVNPKLTFNNFVVGEFNKDAHAAAVYVAKHNDNMFNPLFIYSDSGLGKTHLLHAIGNEIKNGRMPDANILYIDTEQFIEAYIKFAKGESESRSLKDYFSNVDILLLDDVQMLNGKVKTQEMFFSIYQDMIKRGKRIIITSDKQPNDLKGLEDRLVTRFTQGLTVKINQPDIDSCVEILKQKITSAGLDINRFDENVIYFLAEKFSRDVRELEGAVNRLVFSCLKLLDEDRITMDVAIKAVASIKGGKQIANQLTEQKIVNVVADYYNLTPSQITGKDRTGQIVLARHISMYLIRKHLDIPLKKVGEMFGGKDHTTVMSAITKVDKELKTNEQLQSAIADLEKKIKQ
jgi:chromosomal replication initiator protein